MTITEDAESAPRRAAPVKRGSLRKRAYDQLKQMILSGALSPGERLSEIRLSTALGVSRTPLREALMSLETEGLVIGKPNSGYIVVQLDIETVRELLVAREGLDGYAAELAARTATNADLDRLRGVMEQIEDLGRTRTRAPEHIARELELGLKVHEVIVAATGNRILCEMTTRIYEQLRTALWLEVLWIDLWDEAVAEHRAIVEAVIARDGPQASEAARRHVRGSIENISRIQNIQLHRRRAGGLLPLAGV
ncbi:GntR family transcriptional regulator [Inquilinus sp. CAU 1745]|uniref:GntR family transcriptional regulator n=1 Tax=Inquilinus sp. CAU 1745 TaxID=3140369 RepID=UPI00325BCDFD